MTSEWNHKDEHAHEEWLQLSKPKNSVFRAPPNVCSSSSECAKHASHPKYQRLQTIDIWEASNGEETQESNGASNEDTPSQNYGD